MSPRSCCPACGRGPLARLPRDLVRCPAGCVTDSLGWAYLAALDPRPPTIDEGLAELDISQYFAPAYLGLVVEHGFAPLLCCVAQTAGQALEVLQAEWDLRKTELCIVALWDCRAWEERRQRGVVA